MGTMIEARGIVGTNFPTDEGIKLAELLLARTDIDWADLTIRLEGLPAGLLTSSFFNAFLQRIHERQPDLLPRARETKWEAVFPFQRTNISKWMTDFKPYTLQQPKTS